MNLDSDNDGEKINYINKIIKTDLKNKLEKKFELEEGQIGFDKLKDNIKKLFKRRRELGYSEKEELTLGTLEQIHNYYHNAKSGEYSIIVNEDTANKFLQNKIGELLNKILEELIKSLKILKNL